jgi:hypothetical protein
MSSRPEDIETELAALADSTLPAERREQVLAQVADSPELAAELERQRRALAIMRTLERVEAPTLLRRSIETEAAGEGQSEAVRSVSARRVRRVGRPARMRLQAAVALAVVAVVAVALALTTAGNSSSPTAAPTVLQASSVALGSSTQPAPTENPHNSRLLAASAAGVSFPYWGGEPGWQAAGARTDTIGGRTVTTVFYTAHGARRIAYSIVSGDALPVPPASAAIERHGVRFHVVRATGPTVVTWREAGHTCILTARAVDAPTLVHLASWGRS